MTRPDAPQVLITRPAPQDAALAEAVAELGPVRVIRSPVMGIEAIADLPKMDGFAGLIFTSAKAVQVYADLSGRTDLPAYTVGQATCDAARAAGLDATRMGDNADTLIAHMAHAGDVAAPLLHLHGMHTRGAIAARLTEAGVATTGVALYDQPARPLTQAAQRALSGPRPVIVPLYSPRSATLLAKAAPRAPLYVAAFSPAVAKAAAALNPVDLRVCSSPSGRNMVTLIRDLIREISKLEAADGGV